MFGYNKLKKGVSLIIDNICEINERELTVQDTKCNIRAKGYEQLDKMSIPGDAKQAVRAMLESITK